jgi:hypothetical protein
LPCPALLRSRASFTFPPLFWLCPLCPLLLVSLFFHVHSLHDHTGCCAPRGMIRDPSPHAGNSVSSPRMSFTESLSPR